MTIASKWPLVLTVLLMVLITCTNGQNKKERSAKHQQIELENLKTLKIQLITQNRL